MELNVDQLRVVNSKPNGHILVKGVAGSGKTTVAVSKMPMLINYFLDKGDKILFVTYNKTLIEYTKHLLKNVDIQQNLFFDFDAAKQLEIRTVDSIISSYGKELKYYRKIADARQIRESMQDAIGEVRKKYSGFALVSEQNYAFISEEIDWLKSCRYLERDTYQNVDRTGRMSIGENRYRLNKNSPERNAIFDIYLCYEQIMGRKKLVDYKTRAINVLEAFQKGEIKPETYRHIIVDESQDLTRVQLEIIKYLYQEERKDSSIMFVADAAQSIYTQSWLSGQSFKSIGFDMSGKSVILSKNYRTTYEIAQAAYSLIENDHLLKQNDMFVKPVAIERHGDLPYYRHYENTDREAEGIAAQIKKISTRFPLKDIVIAAASKPYLKHLKDTLLARGVPAEIFQKEEIQFEEQVVRLYTLHSIKGLEFQVLFIAGINEGVLPYSESQFTIGRKLLYVGMTRARQELYLSSAKKASVYIEEMDKRLLQNEQNAFSPLYRVELSNYRFVKKIRNLYSREEAVRQWFLNELITKYQYPQSYIDIEYPVQHFSSRGYVDVAVFRFDKGRKCPFILAEIKQPGEDMNRAMAQLKSYAACCPETEYLVVTDGQMMVIENRRGTECTPVHCLPVYQEKEANLYEQYEFVDWRSKRCFDYEINMEDHSEINVRSHDTGEVIACTGYIRIPVVGKVAAGVLKVANEERMGDFSLPDFFAHAERDTFLLQVNGDSMIDFQINDGDYVLIRRQQTAVNKDIVVAGRSGENQVTLKQFCNFGGMIGLMPGNAKYEPIMIPSHELFINGVLTGVLKRK